MDRERELFRYLDFLSFLTHTDLFFEKRGKGKDKKSEKTEMEEVARRGGRGREEG